MTGSRVLPMAAGEDANRQVARRGGIGGFFTARWRGEVPLATLFWRDTIVIGTAINIAATVASLGLLAAKVPLWVALAVHFGPLPYNLFLAFAVWRTADRRGGWAGFFCQTMSLLWLIAAIVI
ncbi:hypothetical protein [Mesorhizobium sp. CN2-181]|uniref:hypothetical protein n=1 Tax=Mesorhizobium yinganensis TaxID=3157707 RepID=UPI0032B80020